MSLHNRYWTLGWPIPLEVTVYGPKSGYSGISTPFLPLLAVNFALWFGVAALSHRVWVHAHVGTDTLPRAFWAGAVCALWGLILSCFALRAAEFVFQWRWTRLEGQELHRSMTSLTSIYPAIYVGFLAAPFVIQFVASQRSRLWPRVVFCSALALLLAAVASPLADRMQNVTNGGLFPIAHPLLYGRSEYAQLLELTDVVGREGPHGLPVKPTQTEGRQFEAPNDRAQHRD